MKARTLAVPVDSGIRAPAGAPLLHAEPSDIARAVKDAAEDQKAAEAVSARNFPQDDEALKAEFVKLRQRLLSFHASGNWSAYRSHSERYEQMAIELGRRLGAEARTWMLEVEPASVVRVMQGWAETDPAGAFREVTRADHGRPCDEELLMKLIEAQKDGAGMKAAVHEVPWHLFDGMVYHPSLDGNTSRREALLLEGANFDDWIDSGAAHAMAEKGVQISRLFYLWGRHDPEQALANWEAWPDERPEVAKARLLEILQAASQDEALVARVRTAWEKMPADGQGKISAVFDDYRKGLPSEWQDPDDRVNLAFQFLAPATPPAE